MATIFQPFKGAYSIPRGQLLAKPLDKHTLLPVGAMRTMGDAIVEVKLKLDQTEIKSNEDPFHAIVDSPTVEMQADLEFSLRQLTAPVSAMAFASPQGLTQAIAAAIPDQQATFNGVDPRDICQLQDENGFPIWPAAIVSITDDSQQPVPWIAGINYIADGPSGKIQIISVPQGSTNNIVVHYSVPAVTQVSALPIYPFLQEPDQYWEIEFRSNNLRGIDRTYHWPLVKTATNGGFKLAEENNDVTKIDFVGKILLHPGVVNPLYARGMIRDLTLLAA